MNIQFMLRMSVLGGQGGGLSRWRHGLLAAIIERVEDSAGINQSSLILASLSRPLERKK
jgi:hypothetical protein